jgi:multiple sugar transport system ATP-binding protein
VNLRIFLFDEPLSNLDAELRVQMRVEIARLHRSLESNTMIYVTHDQVEAMTLADKIVVLQRRAASSRSVRRWTSTTSPVNRFVAGFIGSPQMNLVEAGKLGDTEAKTVGIRPEHITLSRENGDWKGKVIHVEHLGADTILYLETEVTGLLTVRLFGEHKYDVDDIVYATPDKASMHRFGADDRVLR